MGKNYIVGCLLCLAVFVCKAQEDKSILIAGSIIHEKTPLTDVYVKNMTKGNFTITTKKGKFMLQVEEGDTLRCVYMGLKDAVVAVSKTDIANAYMTINMIEEPEELSDVVVEQDTINAVSLGIVSAQKPHYNVDERKAKFVEGRSIESVLMMLSGERKRRLKRLELSIDKKNLDTMFEHFFVYSTTTLGLTDEEFTRFLYYIVDHRKDSRILGAANMSLAEFYVADAFEEYKKWLQQD